MVDHRVWIQGMLQKSVSTQFSEQVVKSIYNKHWSKFHFDKEIVEEYIADNDATMMWSLLNYFSNEFKQS